MSDKPMNFIKVEVLDAEGNRKYKRDLWLCTSGQQKDKISGLKRTNIIIKGLILNIFSSLVSQNY